MLVITTLTPLTTASEGSVTVPTMLPVPTVVCARRVVDIAKTNATAGVGKQSRFARNRRKQTICSICFTLLSEHRDTPNIGNSPFEVGTGRTQRATGVVTGS